MLTGDHSLGDPLAGLVAAVLMAVGATALATVALRDRLRRL